MYCHIQYKTILMLLRLFLLSLIFGWFSVECLVPVPPIYRKAVLALKRYVENPHHNPVTYSLLNVPIHDKQARAFTTDQAIDMALEQIKDLDEKGRTHIAKLLNKVIYGIDCKRNGNNCLSPSRRKPIRPTPDLKNHIVLALDDFFDNGNADDDWPVPTTNKKLNST